MATTCITTGVIFNGVAGFIAATTDAGRTWDRGRLPTGVGNFSNIACPTTSTCYALDQDALGHGTVRATSDAGRTWTLQRLPSVSGYMSGIACPSPIRRVVAVGRFRRGHGGDLLHRRCGGGN